MQTARMTHLLLQIDTVEQLMVLLLVGAPPLREWTVGELGSEVRLSPEELQVALHGLAKAGLVVGPTADGRWAVSPDQEARQAIADLIEAYLDNPVPVLQAMSENAFERIRRAATRLLRVGWSARVTTDPRLHPRTRTATPGPAPSRKASS